MMDKSEILIAFRQAKNKKQQIKVLADINCVAPREIAKIIDEAGELEAAGLGVKSFSTRFVSVPAAGEMKKPGRPKSAAKKAPDPPYKLPPPPPPEPSALTVDSFLALLGNRLAPVLDAKLSINGERVTDVFSFEVTSRGKQVFVDVRTREA